MKLNNINNKFALSQFLNERINFFSFLLINENGENVGIVTKQEALSRAANANLDLFCIIPQSNPPVCKLLDFSKYFYQLKKKENGKTSSKKISLKEVRFSFRISENDANVKIKKIVQWLENEYVVKIALFMRGREQQHKDIALEKCNKVITNIQSFSVQFQLKDEVKLVGNMYNFSFFKNRKAIKNEKN
jgi:translation initiation factor IF-3